MTERHGELTRYLTFKLDKYAPLLVHQHGEVLRVIANEPEGVTFEELMQRTEIGPRFLRKVLKDLFDRNYIITNHQIAKLKEKHGIDAMRLRRYEP